MNGVTVVAEHICRVIELKELIGVGIFITLLCISALLFYWLVYKHFNLNKKYRITFFIYSLLIIIINIVFWIIQTNRYNTIHMEYTVVVDNSVSLTDFYEKYEIVSVNGNEFRVIEK